MKTLKELFDNYRVSVDPEGWNAFSNNPTVKKYNRKRFLRTAALYSVGTLAAAAVVTLAVVLTRPGDHRPVPTTAPEVAQTAPKSNMEAPKVTEMQTSTPEPVAVQEVRSAEPQVPAIRKESASTSTPAPVATTHAPTVAKSAPTPAASTSTLPALPTTPTLPELVTPVADAPVPSTPAAVRTEPDTIHPQQPQIAGKSFFAPNAFSPNGDGVNDIFYVYANTEYTEFELNIYSRNGDHVFQSRHIENGWDGRRKNLGEILPQGVYVYTIKYRTADQNSGVEKGQILLIR